MQTIGIMRQMPRSAPLFYVWLVMVLSLLQSGAIAAGGQFVDSNSPVLGAIRWDAWYRGDPRVSSFRPHTDIVGEAVTADIHEERWHYRVPYYGKVVNSSFVVPGLANSTVVAESQNEYASKYGIGYWAFCAYPLTCADTNPPPSQCQKIQCCADNAALSYGLLRYLESSNRHLVNFSMLLQAGWFPGEDHGSAESLAEEAARLAGYMAMPGYQRTGGRPLLFLLGSQNGARVTQGLEAIADAAKQRGLPAPYVTFMGNAGGDPKRSAEHLLAGAAALGADAVSAYITVQDGGADGAPYGPNIDFTQQLWEAALNPPGDLDRSKSREEAVAPFGGNIRAALDVLPFSATAAGGAIGVVPTMTAGWDPRPRQFVDLPWGNVSCSHGPGHCYMQDPTMAQLTNQTERLLRFLSSDSARGLAPNPSRLGLVSAWDEFDEGHWVAPSLLGGDEKLQAIHAGIVAARGDFK